MTLNRLNLFPNQNSEHRPDQCVAESVRGLASNITGILYDAGFTYGATQHLQGIKPTTAGSDPQTGMESAIIYGLLPETDEDFTALTTSELFEANFDNYSAADKRTASFHTMKGIIVLRTFQQILDYMVTYQLPVSIATKWYNAFEDIGSNGVLPLVTGTPDHLHNSIVYGANGGNLVLESHQGTGYGDGGYCYLDQTLFDSIFVGAYGFNPNAWVWFEKAKILGRHWNAFNDIYPILNT